MAVQCGACGKVVHTTADLQMAPTLRMQVRAELVKAVGPVAVLGRGYALVWDEATGVLLRDAGETELGRHLRVRLHKGTVRATVESKEPE